MWLSITYMGGFVSDRIIVTRQYALIAKVPSLSHLSPASSLFSRFHLESVLLNVCRIMVTSDENVLTSFTGFSKDMISQLQLAYSTSYVDDPASLSDNRITNFILCTNVARFVVRWVTELKN